MTTGVSTTRRPARIAGAAMLAASLTLAGCQTTNQDIGTVAGAVAGAAVGSQIGSGSGRVIATIVGAAAGAWVGNRIGQYLDERDRERMAEATQTTAVSGEPKTWSNPDTGVSGRTEVVETTREQAPAEVPVLKARVQTTPPIDYIGAQYRATSNINVRGGPSTDYVIVGGLSEGETVDVVGQVQGRNWHMIARNNVGEGYVFAPLLEPTGRTGVLVAETAPDDPDVEVTQVQTTRECRTVEQTVVLENGREETETVRACQGPNGWEIV
jgi:surface antigen